jgi:hypothetical protein
VDDLAPRDADDAIPGGLEVGVLEAVARRPITVTSGSLSGLDLMPHSAAAEWWLSTAAGPQANTAAISGVNGAGREATR